MTSLSLNLSFNSVNMLDNWNLIPSIGTSLGLLGLKRPLSLVSKGPVPLGSCPRVLYLSVFSLTCLYSWPWLVFPLPWHEGDLRSSLEMTSVESQNNSSGS